MPKVYDLTIAQETMLVTALRKERRIPPEGHLVAGREWHSVQKLLKLQLVEAEDMGKAEQRGGHASKHPKTLVRLTAEGRRCADIVRRTLYGIGEAS